METGPSGMTLGQQLETFPEDAAKVGQALLPRVALFGFPFVVAAQLAAQQVKGCGGRSDGGGSAAGISYHTVVSLLVTSSVSLGLVGVWAWYRGCVRAAGPEVCAIERTPWSATAGWLEAVDLGVGLTLSYANLVMVLQVIEAVLIRTAIPTYVTVVTVVVVVAGIVGMWTEEITRILAGEPPRRGFLVPQLVPLMDGWNTIIGAKRSGHFERMGCDVSGGRQCRARIGLAFVAFITSSWAVVANLHQELRCLDPQGNIWSTDGASDVLDIVLLEISAFACFTCDWRADADTIGRITAGVILVGGLYVVSCVWLQSSVIV